MLQQKPGDYVVATNEEHSVRELVEKAFAVVGLNPEKYDKIDERFLRPHCPSETRILSRMLRLER
jgi:GDPmannose 4,6-dehydratase